MWMSMNWIRFLICRSLMGEHVSTQTCVVIQGVHCNFSPLASHKLCNEFTKIGYLRIINLDNVFSVEYVPTLISKRLLEPEEPVFPCELQVGITLFQSSGVQSLGFHTWGYSVESR